MKRLVASLAVAAATLAFVHHARADIIPGTDPAEELAANTVTVVNGPEPEADAPPKPQPESRPPQRSFVRGYVMAGAGDGGVFSVRSRAFHGGVGIAVDTGKVSIPIGLELDAGESRSGLTIVQAAFALGVQGVFGRVRLGGGGELSHMWITRSRTFGAVGVGAFLLTSVDVFQFERDRAIFVGLRPSASMMWGEAPAWRAAGVIGLRF